MIDAKMRKGISTSKIWFLGSFPPPVGGKSVINELLARRLSEHREVVRLDISPSTLQRGLSFYLSRVWRTLAVLVTYGSRAQGEALLYVSIDAGLGLLYQLPIILLARVRGHNVAVHHHSFAYIDVGTPQMRFLVRCLPRRSLHVFLCSCMADQYRKRYEEQRDVMILSNIAFFDTSAVQAAPRAGHELVVGLIAHLSSLKGADIFLELLRRAKRRGLPIRGVLAGPFSNAGEEPALRALIAELGPSIDYVGEVGGAAKEAFFGQLDVFLFPTRFRDEAQPLVLFEAACRGIPIISFGRGCVAEDSGGAFKVVEVGHDFVEPALTQLSEWLEFPDQLAAAGAAVQLRFGELRQAAYGQMEALVERLAMI